MLNTMNELTSFLTDTTPIFADSSYSKNLYSIHDLLNNVQQSNESMLASYQPVWASQKMILLTNTFDTNRFCLNLLNLQEHCETINRRAAEWLCKSVAPYRDTVLIAGSIGHVGMKIRHAEMVNGYAEQAAALADGGVDCLWLEGFPTIPQVQAAIQGCRLGAPQMPLIVTMGFCNVTLHSASNPERVTSFLHEQGICCFGADMSAGDVDLASSLGQINLAYDSKLVAKANIDLLATFGDIEENIRKMVDEVVDAGASIVGLGPNSTAEHMMILADQLQRHTTPAFAGFNQPNEDVDALSPAFL